MSSRSTDTSVGVHKPAPTVDPDTAPYWEGLRQNRLLLKCCLVCGRRHFYPRELCPHCHSGNLTWTDAGGLGEIYSYTICHRPAGPAFAADVPYVIAIVTLDEGPRMMTRIVGAHDSVRIGARVKVRFEQQSDDFTLPFFETTDGR